MHDWTKDWYTMRYVLWQWWKWLMLVVFGPLLIPFVAWAAFALGNPAPGAIKSGVGLVSGWACDAEKLEVSFDGGPRLFVPYGSERPDTAYTEDGEKICGDTDNGFGLLWNYNELGAGPHTVALYVDNVLQTQVSFNVVVPETSFLRGISGQGMITLSNGLTATLRWEETTQGFTAINYGRHSPFGQELTEFHFLLEQEEWLVELVQGDDRETFTAHFYDSVRYDHWVIDGVSLLPNSKANLRISRVGEVFKKSPSLHVHHYAWIHETSGMGNDSHCHVILFNGDNITRNADGGVTITGHTTTGTVDRGCDRAEDTHWTARVPVSLHLEPVLEE